MAVQGASKKSSFAPARRQLREVRKPREVLQYDFKDPTLEQRAMTHTCDPTLPAEWLPVARWSR